MDIGQTLKPMSENALRAAARVSSTFVDEIFPSIGKLQPKIGLIMKIMSVEIDGLLNRQGRIYHHFDEELNILTGRNGAGKTSVLKIIWAIVSGNILVALEEVPFQRARLVTTSYDCTVHRIGRRTCKVEFSSDGQDFLFEDITDDDGDVLENAEDLARPYLISEGGSVFFPTFRRIEGGFTINMTRPTGILQRSTRARGELEEGMISLSRALTRDRHLFVSAISTTDIANLLLARFANLSEIANELQAKTSQEVISRIRDYRAYGDETEQLVTATSLLDEVRSRIEKMERERLSIMQPIEEVKSLVERLFEHAGISFGPRMSFGDAASAIDSNRLSAGEKQMLSFVCYNAFYKDSVIFIDEPELSLHADWQRQLFSILDRQQSTNQFVVATHSPFIYSKYPDKELELTADRGDVG
jgi:energy-coupling factor transporter ATP-binding protein EcfA2